MGARGVGANAGLPAHHGWEVSTRWLVFPLPHLGLCSTLDTTWRSSAWASSRSSGHIDDVRNVALGSRGRRSRYLRCSHRPLIVCSARTPPASAGRHWVHEWHDDTVRNTTLRRARSASRLQQRPLRPSLGRPVSTPEWMKAHNRKNRVDSHSHKETDHDNHQQRS